MKSCFKKFMGLCLVLIFFITNTVPLFAVTEEVTKVFTQEELQALFGIMTCFVSTVSNDYSTSRNSINVSPRYSLNSYYPDGNYNVFRFPFVAGTKGLYKFTSGGSISLDGLKISMDLWVTTFTQNLEDEYYEDRPAIQFSSMPDSISVGWSTSRPDGGGVANLPVVLTGDTLKSLSYTNAPLISYGGSCSWDYTSISDVDNFPITGFLINISSFPISNTYQSYDIDIAICNFTVTGIQSRVMELEEAVGQIIENQNKNTQDIIDNQDKNTQDIIDNQDKNTQEIIDSFVTPPSDFQGDVHDFNNQIDAADKKLDDLAEDMHVDVPDLDSELDLSIIDENFNTEYTTSLFSVIFGHSFIVSLVLLSLTFSVVGVIIHGKG